MNELAPAPATPLRLGFARGTAPAKWAQRWRAAGGGPLELVALPVTFGRGADRDPLTTTVPQAEAVPAASADTETQVDSAEAPLDVIIERARPGAAPEGAGAPDERTHFSLRLYTEAVALVVATDHELAEQTEVTLDELELVTLLDHPDHAPQWPTAEPWQDASWMPKNAAAALALVATGAGAVLLPLPLARHLASKREHAVLTLVGDEVTERAPGSTVWATWTVGRDAADVQQLAGIMRGRTARSSRASSAENADGATGAAGSAATKAAAAKSRAKPAAKKKGPKPGSRGAQLAAAKEKAERARAIKRSEKRRKRR